MFQDFLTEEGVNEHDAGKKVIDSVAHEVRRFFEKSVQAEREERQKEIEGDRDPQGNIAFRMQPTDYGSMITTRST